MSFRSALALSCREPKVSISAIYLSICHLCPDNFYILFTLNNLFTFTLSHRDLHNIMCLIYIDVITTTRSDISYYAHFCFQCIYSSKNTGWNSRGYQRFNNRRHLYIIPNLWHAIARPSRMFMRMNIYLNKYYRVINTRTFYPVYWINNEGGKM